MFNLDNDVINNSIGLNAGLSYANLYPYYVKGHLQLPTISFLDRIKYVLSNFRLYNFLAYLKNKFLYTIQNYAMQSPIYTQKDWDQTEQSLKAFQDYAKRENIKLIIYGVSMDSESLRNRSNKVDTMMKIICQKQAIIYYSNINKRWQSAVRNGNYPALDNEGHPNLMGHTLIAKDLNEILHTDF